MKAVAVFVAVTVLCSVVVNADLSDSDSEAVSEAELSIMRMGVYGNDDCATTTIPGFNYALRFAEFCSKFGKVYQMNRANRMYNTQNKRFLLWKATQNCIYAHSQTAGTTYAVGINHMADHTREEYEKRLGYRALPLAGRFKQSFKLAKRQHKRVLSSADTLTESEVDIDTAVDTAVEQSSDDKSGQSFDWGKKGKVTSVGYQQQCGDCWAFAAKTVAESAWAIAGNHLKSVSAQHINDCSDPKTCSGCNGGVSGEALKSMMAGGGFCSDTEVRFKAKNLACNNNCKKVVQLSNVNTNYYNKLHNDKQSQNSITLILFINKKHQKNSYQQTTL